MLGLSILIGVAVAGTILWLGGAAYYIGDGIGWGNLTALTPTEAFTVAAAAVSPVVGLWLLIAFLGNSLSMVQQGKTIRQFMWQARRSADHTEIVARMLLEMQNHAQKAVFFDKVDHLVADLNAAICEIAEKAGMLGAEEAAQVWRRTADGDRWIFARLFTDAELRGERLTEALGKLAAEDQNLRQAVFNFFRRYDHLMAMLKKHDTDGLLVESIEESPVGKLHIIMARTSHFRAEALMSRTLADGKDAHEPAPPEVETSEPSVAEASSPYAVETEATPVATEPAVAPAYTPAPLQGAVIQGTIPRAPAPLPTEPTSADGAASADEPPPVAPAPDIARPAAMRPQPSASVPTTSAPAPAPAKPEGTRQTDLFAERANIGQPFSPLTPGFPEGESWPATEEPRGKPKAPPPEGA